MPIKSVENASSVRAYIADITEQKDRSRVMGKIMASFSLGLIIGPAIGGIRC